MNVKFSLLLPGAIALALSAGSLLPAVALPTSMPIQIAQKGANKLNLTDDQKAQMKQIREATQSQIDSVLTQSQKDQIAAAKQQGQRMRGSFRSLNLTDDQKARIQAIRQESRKQMDAILTPEQRQQMQQWKATHQQRSMRRGTTPAPQTTPAQ